MLNRGRECIKGHRAALVVMQLFIAACWLIPIVVELFCRRFLPVTTQWQSVSLLGSYLLNRFLVAPAHTGYYAGCRRLATVTMPTAITSEIEDLREELTAPTLLACFFLDYRHPIKSLKWQLKYDAFRFALFAVLQFPAIVFLAVGSSGESVLLQAVCFGGALLCGFLGGICAFFCVLRLRPMLYRRPQYHSFLGQVVKAMQLSRGKLTNFLSLRVKCIPFTLVLGLPFTCFRAALSVEEAILLAVPTRTVKKRKEKVFQTRVLRDA